MAVALKPIQQLNKETGPEEETFFAPPACCQQIKMCQRTAAPSKSCSPSFTVRAVDLQTGEYVDDVDVGDL